jgi:hypothetical protein
VVEYGTLAAGASEDTVTLGDTQTATNNGNVTEDFNIKGQNSANWTLGPTSGDEIYRHEFSNTASFPGTALTTDYQTLATGVGTTTGIQDFDLKITTPNPTANFAEQSVNVTVQAVTEL